MKVIEGDFKDSQALIITSSSGKTLQIKTRLLVARVFQIPSDLREFSLLEKDEGHSFGRYVIMILLSLTIVGLLISIPMYFFGKSVDFKVRVKTKSGERFTIEGDKADWKEVKPLLM